MRYFHINGTMNEDLLDKFIDFANHNQSDGWGIVINSGGGKTSVYRTMMLMIDSHIGEKCLIFNGGYSCAFNLFYESKCLNKYITKGAVAMYHMTWLKDVGINAKGDFVYDEDKNSMKNMNEHELTECIQIAEAIMNKKELRLFNKGEDVYFTFKRLKQIFPSAIIV